MKLLTKWLSILSDLTKKKFRLKLSPKKVKPSPEKAAEKFREYYPIIKTKEKITPPKRYMETSKIDDQQFYNVASAEKLGWDPSWFGVPHFDEELTRAIAKWQRARQLTPDGLVGPRSFRRLWTEREANIDDWAPPDVEYSNHLVHNGTFYPIEWDKVVLWSEKGGLKAAENSYYSYAGKKDRKPKFFVNHWDVCLSSKSCANVLARRGISVHFCIDNDGTIYQLLDTQHGAWHAGGGKWNRTSIGVEISNAYYPKYQSTYVERGFGERPIISGEKLHGGRLPEFLGFYPVQIEALKALWKATHDHLNIPYSCPLDTEGNTLRKVSSETSENKFEGFVSHYHLTNRKIDCAGLDIAKLLKELE